MNQTPPAKDAPPKDAAAAKGAATPPPKPADKDKAAPKGATTPPPKAAAPEPKKKKGGFRWRLYLFVLVVLAGAAVYYLPKQVEWLTGVKIPSFIPSHSSTAERIPKPTPPKKEAAQTGGTASGAAATATAEEESPMDVLSTRVRQLRQSSDNNRRELGEVQSRVLQNEQQLTRLAGQVADLGRQQDGNAVQLQIIALQLQLDGDTQAAAEALGKLAVTTDDTAAARAMLDESARLENIPARAVLLSLLDEALLPPEKDAAAQAAEDEGWLGSVKRLLNYTDSPGSASLTPAQRQISQLQLHLLTRRDTAYWRLLQQMRADNIGDEQVQALLLRLHDYGAPDYQLRLR